MAERKPVAVVKAQLPAGKATAGQQLGGALGPRCKHRCFYQAI